MASARCYTKSGSVEKYESNAWSSPSSGNWSPSGVVGKITTPDSRGNYTVTPPNNFVDSNTPTEFYCYTMYGGIKKTFYFKENIQTRHVINLSCSVNLYSGGSMHIMLKFNDNNKYLGNDKLSVEVVLTTTITPNVFIDSVSFTVTKYSTSPLRNYINIGPEVGKKYVARITSCRPGSGDGYIVNY